MTYFDQSAFPKPNARYWSPLGTTILCVEHDLYKIDGALLPSKLHTLTSLEIDGYQCHKFPESWEISSKDFELLLDHIEKSKPLDSFDVVARLLVISDRLDLPAVNLSARKQLESIFPMTPTPYFKSEYTEEALILATKYNISSIQKHLYYTLVTTSNIGTDDHAQDLHPSLDPAIVKRSKHLLTSLIDHFAPILFTVATGAHMACTDIFAEQWMPLVIAPSLSDDGVSQPFETLQRIIDTDWKSLGMCEECVEEKKIEWRGEMDMVWEKMDVWLQ